MIGSRRSFPHLTGPSLDTLADAAEKVAYGAGETILEQGDVADRFYVIAGGEVTVTRRSLDGDDVELATLGPGHFFGEVGLLAETRRTATVRAVDDVELLSLDWSTFQSALEQSDPTSRDFAAIVKERTAQVA
jgi:CRP-like cAMP-binding protein